MEKSGHTIEQWIQYAEELSHYPDVLASSARNSQDIIRQYNSLLNEGKYKEAENLYKNLQLTECATQKLFSDRS